MTSNVELYLAFPKCPSQKVHINRLGLEVTNSDDFLSFLIIGWKCQEPLRWKDWRQEKL